MLYVTYALKWLKKFYVGPSVMNKRYEVEYKYLWSKHILRSRFPHLKCIQHLLPMK
jgi:hypothetical protein